jgi:hypothetical protein
LVVWSAKTVEQMMTSRAASTKPDMHSTPCDPSGNPVHYPSKTRSESSTLIWRQFSFMGRRPGEWPIPTLTNSRHPLTGVYTLHHEHQMATKYIQCHPMGES